MTLVWGEFLSTRMYNDERVMKIINSDIMWPTIYTGWQESWMDIDLEFLVLIFFK